MKRINLLLLILVAFAYPAITQGASFDAARSGYIFLQVETHGEAWYVYPKDNRRYYLGRPTDAFAIMRSLALGARHDFLSDSEIFPQRLSGMILLDVERNGEAYYINPANLKKYYLGRPADAYRIMRELGRGISNSGLDDIAIGSLNDASLHTSKIIQNVPFTSQAPFGAWSDQRQEDGCEEASVLMAIRWAQGKGLTSTEALKEITGISDWLLEKYGEYRDISTVDTLNWIIRDHFQWDKAALKKNISLAEIIAEIKKGNVVIAPMDGQKLKNPYFTAPGPVHHMLVIIGYDPVKNVFITNDPGTKRGSHYEYGTRLLFDAIRDYPTGWHESTATIEKDVIVVWK